MPSNWTEIARNPIMRRADTVLYKVEYKSDSGGHRSSYVLSTKHGDEKTTYAKGREIIEGINQERLPW